MITCQGPKKDADGHHYRGSHDAHEEEGIANPKREKIVIKPLAGDAGLWATITPVKTPMTTAVSMAVRTRSAVAQITPESTLRPASPI